MQSISAFFDKEKIADFRSKNAGISRPEGVYNKKRVQNYEDASTAQVKTELASSVTRIFNGSVDKKNSVLNETITNVTSYIVTLTI